MYQYLTYAALGLMALYMIYNLIKLKQIHNERKKRKN